MSKYLRWLLCRYFTLGVVEGESGGEGTPAEGADAGAEGADAGADDASGDLDLGAGDLDSIIEAGEAALPDADGKPAGRENAAIRDARKRAQDAEEAKLRMEGELAAERRMRQAPTQPSADQRIWEEEQRKLADPNIPQLEKWQIESNRTIRASKQESAMALRDAADMRDQAQFERIAVKAPKFYDRYAPKVEKALAEMRARGENAPRAAVLRFIVGNDQVEALMNGKSSKAAKPAAAAAPAVNRVPRGQPPGARSDVSSRQRLTEKEAVRKRLEGVQI